MILPDGRMLIEEPDGRFRAVRGRVDCYTESRWMALPHDYEQGLDLLQIVVTADGLGDHLLGLTAAAGLKRDHPDKEIVYSVRHRGLACWLTHFGGHDTLVYGALDCPTFRPHDTYAAQIDGRTWRGRWRYYAEACGTTAVLPPVRPQPLSPHAGAVLLCPGTAKPEYGDRRWPPASWLELERLLREAGVPTVVIDDDPLRVAGFASPKLLRGTPAEVIAAVHGAACLVGNDSGMAHLAGMLSTPTVALCGVIEGGKIFGLYPTVRPIDGPLGCTGCHWRGETRKRAGCGPAGCASLNLIAPGEVLAAALDAIGWRAQQHSLLGPGKTAQLRRLVRATAGVPGDLAELGVYQGGSALALATADPSRRTLHLFDTFAGLPAPTGPDAGTGMHEGGLAGDEAAVRALLAGLPVELHRGVFPASTAGLPDRTYSLVHVDGDWYETTAAALDYFWPRLSPGGALVIDDWHWPDTPGVDRAVTERFAAAAIEDGYPNSCIIRKPGGP
jgi:predicted O-methyltransferase YrrM